ncbi:MAG: kelch repeat-containing protein [Fermentimonas sp.]|nr:kelch repeat-containing protein [Fermentimonas sp.]
MKKRFSISIISFIISIVCLSQETNGLAGLYFTSGEAVQDKRTSLNLTPYESLKANGGITVDFDLNFRQGDGHYGYIFRIITDDSDNFDLIANLGSDTNTFSLVFKDEILFTFHKSELPDFQFDTWMKFVFGLNLEKKVVSLSISDVTKSVNIQTQSVDNYKLFFGLCNEDPFQTTDVCPMTLRNITISDVSGAELRNWPLSKHGDTKTYDKIVNAIAVVQNPEWLIDSHLIWNNLRQFTLQKFYGVAGDPENSYLYFVDVDKIISYNLTTDHFDTIPYLSGKPYGELNEKHVIFNPYTDEIWSYNLDQLGISRFNFSSKSWSANPTTMEEANFAHHNKFFSPTDSSLVVMFGYGQYRYNSVVYNYDPKKDLWSEYERINQIEPRYLAATGFLDSETLLVFGGYGSKSGRQEVMPKSFNDLYAFDINTNNFEKIAEYKPFETSYVPIESLVLDSDTTGFYTLVYDRTKYNTQLRLIRNGIYEPTHVIYPDSIEYNFLDTESWANIYLHNESGKMFVVTANKTDIAIYSMAYPPLMIDDVIQVEPVIKNVNKSNIRILLLIVLIIISVGIVIASKRKLRKKSDNAINDDYKSIFRTDILYKEEQNRKSSIIMHGNFQLYDYEGNIISNEMSPTLKHLFLIIFLNTVNSGNGISSKRLDETLWYNKNEKSARNNRNVNISKLRTYIAGIKGLELINENSLWSFNISSDIFCDYLLINNIISHPRMELKEDELIEVIGLLNKGNFLSDVEVDWLDTYKSNYVNLIINFLLEQIKQPKFSKNYQMQILLADTLMSFDSLNEEALFIKCKALHKEGKGGQSYEVYKSFAKEYRSLLNEDYPVTFNDIIKNKK